MEVEEEDVDEAPSAEWISRILKGPGALCAFPQTRNGPLHAMPCGWMNDDPRHVIGFRSPFLLLEGVMGEERGLAW